MGSPFIPLTVSPLWKRGLLSAWLYFQGFKDYAIPVSFFGGHWKTSITAEICLAFPGKAGPQKKAG